ncbi:MAG TPA: hypothetical protein VE197_21270, partial [Mycobacterium sp.]|nr:hypothetical protein [Mycobacterium sp.]
MIERSADGVCREARAIGSRLTGWKSTVLGGRLRFVSDAARDVPGVDHVLGHLHLRELLTQVQE